MRKMDVVNDWFKEEETVAPGFMAGTDVAACGGIDWDGVHTTVVRKETDDVRVTVGSNMTTVEQRKESVHVVVMEGATDVSGGCTQEAVTDSCGVDVVADHADASGVTPVDAVRATAPAVADDAKRGTLMAGVLGLFAVAAFACVVAGTVHLWRLFGRDTATWTGAAAVAVDDGAYRAARTAGSDCQAWPVIVHHFQTLELKM